MPRWRSALRPPTPTPPHANPQPAPSARRRPCRLLSERRRAGDRGGCDCLPSPRSHLPRSDLPARAASGAVCRRPAIGAAKLPCGSLDRMCWSHASAPPIPVGLGRRGDICSSRGGEQPPCAERRPSNCAVACLRVLYGSAAAGLGFSCSSLRSPDDETDLLDVSRALQTSSLFTLADLADVRSGRCQMVDGRRTQIRCVLWRLALYVRGWYE